MPNLDNLYFKWAQYCFWENIDNIYISSAPVVQKIPIIQTKIISKKGMLVFLLLVMKAISCLAKNHQLTFVLKFFNRRQLKLQTHSRCILCKFLSNMFFGWYQKWKAPCMMEMSRGKALFSREIVQKFKTVTFFAIATKLWSLLHQVNTSLRF